MSNPSGVLGDYLAGDNSIEDEVSLEENITMEQQKSWHSEKDPLKTEGDTPSNLFSRLAKSFRQLGVVAVVVAAVIYMLQGVDSVSLEFRQWAWLALMVVMGAGGFICRFLLQDVRSARVFFVLATALVTVQFSQLGGMVFDFLYPVANTLDSAGTSLFTLVLNGASALVLSLVFIYTCFSILVREKAKILSMTFLLFNILLLIPDRASLIGLMLPVAMMASVFFLVKNVFSQHVRFNTREGLLVKMMMLIPVGVMIIRNGFHIDSMLSFGGIGLLVASFVIYCIPYVFDSNRLRELCLWLGGVVAGLVWSVLALSGEVLGNNLAISFSAISYGLPIALLMFELGRLSHFNQSVFHKIGCIILAVTSFIGCFNEAGLISTSAVGGVGILSLTIGIMARYKSLVYAGAFSIILSICSLMFLSLASVSINIWLVLAIGGSILVLLSSVLEKHGRSLMQYASQINDFD